MRTSKRSTSPARTLATTCSSDRLAWSSGMRIARVILGLNVTLPEARALERLQASRLPGCNQIPLGDSMGASEEPDERRKAARFGLVGSPHRTGAGPLS